MVIRILAQQIPRFWVAIKFAASATASIPNHDKELYLNNLLASLLNDTAQCFIRYNDEKELLAIAITRFIQDEITGEKTLFINCLYSFKGVDNEEWEHDFGLIKDFAKSSGCKKITTYSNNPRVFEIVKLTGFAERFRCFLLDV